MNEIASQFHSISKKLSGASDRIWRPIRSRLSSPSARPSSSSSSSSSAPNERLFEERRYVPPVERHTQKLVFNDHQQLAFRNMEHEKFKKAQVKSRVHKLHASAVG